MAGKGPVRLSRCMCATVRLLVCIRMCVCVMSMSISMSMSMSMPRSDIIGAFHDLVPEAHPAHAALLKTFKRKIKRASKKCVGALRCVSVGCRGAVCDVACARSRVCVHPQGRQGGREQRRERVGLRWCVRRRACTLWRTPIACVCVARC